MSRKHVTFIAVPATLAIVFAMATLIWSVHAPAALYVTKAEVDESGFMTIIISNAGPSMVLLSATRLDPMLVIDWRNETNVGQIKGEVSPFSVLYFFGAGQTFTNKVRWPKIFKRPRLWFCMVRYRDFG